VREDPRYIRGIETGRSELAIPLSAGGEFLGVLDIESPEVDAFSRRDIHVLKLFANQVAMALDKARLFQRLEEQARTDGLTGLLNQRTFHDRLGREVARTRRTNRPFALVLLDMDNLKELNDECGHPAGNLALCRVAEVVRQHSRSIDSAARYGGDEFALILAETDLDGAVVVAERLRRAVDGIQVEGFGNVSASCGVAAFPTCAHDEAELVYLADRAMYEAKRGGRNRVAAASVKG
jgi:diguanylate cyclase (GGDEF)-like protein